MTLAFRATICSTAIWTALVFALAAVTSFAQAQSLEERLAKLDPARPQQYKVLAEELAARTGDAEARRTAMRLFHIAAWLEPQTLAAGSLRSMIAIARTPDEEKRLRAAAFLLDPAAEESELRVVGASSVVSSLPPPPELQRAVRLLRQGSRDSARQLIAATRVQEYLAAESQRKLRDELAAIVTANTLADRQLRRLLELELQWSQLRRNSGGGIAGPNSQPWQDLSRDALAATPTAPTLLTLTEFDPRENLYRNGRWVRGE